MRIRSIKPEFWRSEDISALDWHDRLVFVGMWSYVDDNGVGKDRISAIAADLFADDLYADSMETIRRVSLALERLATAGLIKRYSVDGTRYLYVTNWKKHQLVKNPNKPRYPLPTSENAVSGDSLPRVSPDSTENLPTGTEEQGNRGTGEQENPSAFPSDNAAAAPTADTLFDDIVDADLVDDTDSTTATNDTTYDTAKNLPAIVDENAGTITKAWIDHCTAADVTLPRRIIGQYAKAIKTAVDEGTSPELIKRALASMLTDAVADKPSWLPARIVKVQTGPEVHRRAQPRSTTDDRVDGWLALGAHMEGAPA